MLRKTYVTSKSLVRSALATRSNSVPCSSRQQQSLQNFHSTRHCDSKTAAEVSMEAKLTDVLKATFVNVEDQSGGCGAQYLVECESSLFEGLSTIKQHRLVSKALKEEVADMHAIRIFTAVPKETQ
eukprot:m.101589 g.101589  ORF g.101589 m.101589 type:complete len:126 (+) comp16810_c0_seq1:224-601(+)